MATNREIDVFLIAGTQARPSKVQAWLRRIGVENVASVSECAFYGEQSDGEALIALAGKRCYNSFEPGLNPNVTKIREDLAEYIDNILASGHGSVLEHASYSFAIEGLTRVATAELNRHRAGVAISEGSMRFIRVENLEWWLPLSLRRNEGNSSELALLKEETELMFRACFESAERYYKGLCKLWQVDTLPMSRKKELTSLFRRILPMGVCTGGVWTLNLRALRHVITQRSSPGAEEEICLIASMMLKLVAEESPLVFGDFVDDTGYWVPKYKKV